MKFFFHKSQILFFCLFFLSPNNSVSAFQTSHTTVLLVIDSELRQFVDKVQEIYSEPLANYAINRQLLQAALMFDAFGAYGIRFKSKNKDAAFALKLMNADSLTLTPDLSVFARLRGNEEELLLIYAAALEAAGIPTAILQTPQRFYVMINTGIHRKYAGSVSRDITSYLIKNDYVYLCVDMQELGKPFYRAWQNTRGKLKGKQIKFLPVNLSFSAKDKSRRVNIFVSKINRKNIDKRFDRDKNYFEGQEQQSKLQKVTEVKARNQRQALRHLKKGQTLLNLGSYEKAILELEKAIDFGGDQGKALYLIAKAFGENKQFQKMKQTALRLIEFNHRDPRGFRILGIAYYYTGQPKIADGFYSKANYLEKKIFSLK